MTENSALFIRPLSLGELLDQAIRIYRRKFLTLVGILVIPYFPIVVIQAFSSYIMVSSITGLGSNPNILENPSYWTGILGTYGTLILQFFLVQGVGAAALTRVAADSYTSRPTGIMEAYRQIAPSLGRVLLTLFVTSLIFLAALIWLIIPCIGWFTGPGVIFFLVSIVVPLIIPITILEKKGGFDAFRRAWDLGRSRFWWLLGFAFVLSLLGQLLVSAPVYLVNFLVNFVVGSQIGTGQVALLSSVVSSLTGFATGLLFMPLSITAMTVVYFDLRVRSEGLDLAMQAASQTDPDANIATLAETTPSGPLGSFVTGTDVAYFVLLTMIFIALYFLLFFVILIPLIGLTGLTGGGF
jgi:hypothetical protein